MSHFILIRFLFGFNRFLSLVLIFPRLIELFPSSPSIILTPSPRLCSYSLISYFSINHSLYVCLSLHNMLLFMNVYLSCLKSPISLSHSLYFSLFSINLPSPLYSYLFLSLASISLLLYSLLILLTSHSLYSYHSFNSFFFLSFYLILSPCLLSLAFSLFPDVFLSLWVNVFL